MSGIVQAEKDRHQELNDHFKANQDARLLQRKLAAQEANELKDPKENTDLFWKTFYDGTKSISSTLIELEKTKPEASQATKELESIHPRMAVLEKLINDSTIFLPKFDLRRSQEQIKDLKADIERVKGIIIPRKKFSFGKKNKERIKKKDKPTVSNENTADSNIIPKVEELNLKTDYTEEEHGFFNETDKVLIIERPKSATADTKSRNFILKNLKNCTIVLLEVFSALRSENLENCKIFSAPVSGSAFVENCKNCIFYYGSRQLRIHDTYNTDFYVYTRSGPIIEDCGDCRFAPYKLNYPNIESDLQQAELSGHKNFWYDVKDFKWHKAQHSPNWSELPEDERLKVLDSNLPVSIVGDHEEEEL